MTRIVMPGRRATMVPGATCPKGHRLEGKNVIEMIDRGRMRYSCRTCRREARRRRLDGQGKAARPTPYGLKVTDEGVWCPTCAGRRPPDEFYWFTESATGKRRPSANCRTHHRLASKQARPRPNPRTGRREARQVRGWLFRRMLLSARYRGATIGTVAEVLGVSPRSLKNWYSGRVPVNVEDLVERAGRHGLFAIAGVPEAAFASVGRRRRIDRAHSAEVLERLRAGWSRVGTTALAEALGIPVTTVRHWVHGHRRPADPRTVLSLVRRIPECRLETDAHEAAE